MAHRLREIIANPGIVVVPGAFNALVARVIQDMGFPAVYATGAGIANSTLAFPDVGLLSYKEILEAVRYIVDAVDIPVIADADTGYGGPVNVIRTVREFEKAGVAALQIEDQLMPKRCGHFSGKQVITTEEMVQKVKAAVDTRIDPDLVIIARTDARSVTGLEDALYRAERYIEAGADMIFVEAPRSVEELKLIGSRLRAPSIANMLEGGKTPLVPAAQLEEFGFKMVLYANLALRASIKACQEVLACLRDTGWSQPALSRIVSMDERNRLTRYDFIEEAEKRYNPNFRV
ncbi:MAG TPA: carboxyvinyl-carboxyphosphonate phosphorylmutase [Clostridia bacterium]|nr:carboxyvinyl-carboxyphosphonate phosphorylmutase [Clostridia bacterium]